jgi:hypothetical protein
MQKLLGILSLVLLTLGSGLATAADGDGGYAGAFFQVPIGARPTGMGGAYRAISDDGAGVLFNPAGMAGLQKKTFATSYRAMKLDRKLGYATLLFPAAGNSAIGVHWLYANSGSVARRNNDGDLIGDDLTMHSHDFAIVFAKRFEDFVSVGVKMNYLASRFAEMSTYTVGIDVGALVYVDHIWGRENQVKLPLEDLRIGLTLKYLDADFNWNNEEYVLRYIDGESGLGTEQMDVVPSEFGAGISGRLFDRHLVLASDLVINTEQSAAIHAGAEYFVRPETAVRAGFSNGRLTAGAGHVFKIGKQLLAVDYAFSTDKADEGSEHIFSFDFLF